MSKNKKVAVIVDSLFDIPYKNVGKITFDRAGQTYELKIQSLNELEQEELRNKFPQPEPPVKKVTMKDEYGNPKLYAKGPMAGKHMVEEVRDYDDKEYLEAQAKYITDVAAGAAAMGLMISFAKDKDDKRPNEEIPLEEKIVGLKKLFNYESINYIGQEVLKLSQINYKELEEAVKN